MIWFVISPMGSGKTLTLTFLGYAFHLAGFPIFSNYKVSFKHTPIVEPEEINRIKNGVFLGDELWAWLDSRMSSSRQNRLISNILLKSRKRGYDIIHTAQFRHQADKRLREHTDYFIIPSYSAQEKVCNVSVYRYYGHELINPKPNSQFSFKAEPIFDMYNSWEGIYGDQTEPDEDF